MWTQAGRRAGWLVRRPSNGTNDMNKKVRNTRQKRLPLVLRALLPPGAFPPEKQHNTIHTHAHNSQLTTKLTTQTQTRHYTTTHELYIHLPHNDSPLSQQRRMKDAQKEPHERNKKKADRRTRAKSEKETGKQIQRDSPRTTSTDTRKFHTFTCTHTPASPLPISCPSSNE